MRADRTWLSGGCGHLVGATEKTAVFASMAAAAGDKHGVKHCRIPQASAPDVISRVRRDFA
jgi:hypothetical protein